MKRLRVEVTQEDIDNGVGRNCKLCPMALAVNRLFPGEEWSVNHVEAHFESRGYTHSRAAERFVDRFDRGEPVRPATFMLKPWVEQ